MNRSLASLSTVHRPYPGLRPFRRDEANRFFGREEQIDQMLDKLAETHFLAVLGTSGSGKSSLVHAGLLPALASGILVPSEPSPAASYWSIAELRPGDQPFRHLATTLVCDTGIGRDYSISTQGQTNYIAEVERDLRSGRRALKNRLDRQPLPAGERLLILVDQFEELFRFRRDDAKEAAAFVALLLATYSHLDCYLVITMRSEFLGDCARYPDLPEAINTGLFLTPRLSPEQLTKAIRSPVQLPEYDGNVSSGLVRRLLDEVADEQDQLPLLQHLLMRLWDGAIAADREKPVLDEVSLNALGGLNAALGRHAERAFSELDSDQQGIAETLFRALTERVEGERDIRRPVRISEVANVAGVPPDRVIACTEPFRRADRNFLLLSADQRLGPEDTIDITHEALIRQWSRLRDWTADEAEQAELYQRLAADARRWERGESALWIDPNLQFALDWREQHRPSAAWAARYGGDFDLAIRFLDAGRDRREKERAAEEARRQKELRQAWITAGISILALIFTLLLAGWALVQKQRALEEEAEAVAAKQQRTEQLFESGLTHAALLAQDEDYAAAWRILGQTVALDNSVPAERRHARNLLAGFVDLRRGEADRIYRGADAALADLALSPDGRWLVASGERGELVVFDAHSGELTERLEGHDPEADEVGGITTVRFTADGETMISAGEDRQIIHWSVPDWQIEHRWQAPAAVFSLALSPDGKTLASAGQSDVITLWSMADGESRTLSGESSLITHGTGLAWLPDGRLISGGHQGQLGIWDPATWEEQLLPRIHTERINAVAISPDGGLIATGGADKTIIIWDATSRRPLRRLHGHRNLVLGLAFDRSGERLLSASYDNDLRLWDVASGTTLRVFQGHVAGLWSVIVRDGHAYTAANDGTLRRWPLAQTGWIWDLQGQAPISARLLPDPTEARTGELFVGFENGAVAAYALPSPTKGATRTHPTAAEPEQPGDSEQALHGPVGNGPRNGPYPNPATPVGSALPHAPGLEELEQVHAHAALVNRFALAPDGRMLATASMDNTARVWRIHRNGNSLSLESLHRFDQHSDAVHAVAFSPDGRLLATAGYDGQVGLFDLATGAGEPSQVAASGKIAAVEFTPDGSSLITAHIEERRLRVWQRDGLQLTNGRTIAELSDLPLWASLSPAGRRATVVGRQWIVTLHDLDPPAGDAEPPPLVGHESTVYRAIFTPDGRQFATVSSDMTVRLWDLGPDAAPADTPGQALFTLRLPTQCDHGVPLWDFDFRCGRDQADCWIAVPLTIGRIALYRLPYAQPPAGLGRRMQ